ncbi:MAG: rhamnulokinase [Planctomycetota bacterium]
MSQEHKFCAIDLGAESGRGIVVTLKDKSVSMEEIHRWPNRPVRMGGTLYWDVQYLFAEILVSLKHCTERKIPIESISIDTWGVDFGLLDANGRLLSNPVHYRDGRTEKIHEYSNAKLSTDRIFELTAYEPWAIASLFQLLAMQRDSWPALEMAQTFLNMPDLLLYFLTGVKASEMSIANTSNLMGTDKAWSPEIIDAFNLPDMFGELNEPATVLGPLSDEVAELTGLGKDIPVIATCGHDTSAAVAAVPGQGENWAFLSCGTWSILGELIDHPVTEPKCLELGWTNEYAIGGWYIAKNILGLWLIQELKRKWDSSSDPWDYDRMTAEAGAAETNVLINAQAESLLAPADMEQALYDLIEQSGQARPASRGELVRAVTQSLALEYACGLDDLETLTGTRPEALYIVGGGIKNKLLCQLTANACGVPVHAGADQCTAMGNGLGQALALGILDSPEAIRDVMRASFTPVEYRPQDAETWKSLKDCYRSLRG